MSWVLTNYKTQNETKNEKYGREQFIHLKDLWLIICEVRLVDKKLDENHSYQ